MKIFTSFSICLLTLFGTTYGDEFPVQDVLDMASRDTEVRHRWIQKNDAETAKELRFQEIGNSAFLKEIISKFGIPTDHEVSELDASIIQLVLHSSDLDFQKEVLAMLSSSLGGDMIAILTDRVLLRQGLKQKFGTHLLHTDGKLVPYPIEQPETINQLRREVGESTLEKYLEVMNGFDRALSEESDNALYKIVFNMVYDFHECPDNYLYYASFQTDSDPYEEEGLFLAFEDPSLAAAFALLLTTPVNGDIFFEEKNLLVSLSPQSVDDALILGETPIYMNLVERKGFSPHEIYGPEFLNRVYATKDKVEPFIQFQCRSPLDTLILAGSKIQIHGMGMDYEYQDTLIREKIYSMLYFDITLENEPLSE